MRSFSDGYQDYVQFNLSVNDGSDNTIMLFTEKSEEARCYKTREEAEKLSNALKDCYNNVDKSVEISLLEIDVNLDGTQVRSDVYHVEKDSPLSMSYEHKLEHHLFNFADIDDNIEEVNEFLNEILDYLNRQGRVYTKSVFHRYALAKAEFFRDAFVFKKLAHNNLSHHDISRLFRKIGKSNYNRELENEWKYHSESVVYDLYHQLVEEESEEFIEELMITEGLKLIVNSNNTVWGYANGKGQNKLGQILEQIRDELLD